MVHKEYESKVAATAMSFDDFYKNHVKSELKKFDMVEIYIYIFKSHYSKVLQYGV